jgi:hypothetical protein
MYQDIYTDILFLFRVSKDDRTETQFIEETTLIKEEIPVGTPIYQLDFKKPLSPIRKYYHKLITNFTIKLFNEIVNESKFDKLEEEYQYSFHVLEKNIKQYFSYIREHIINYNLTEELYNTPSKEKIADESYVTHLIKFNCIMLYLELQDRFQNHINIDALTLEEIFELLLFEEAPKKLIIINYDGDEIQYVQKAAAKGKGFNKIMGDLEHRSLNTSVLNYDQLINKKELFATLEYKLFEEGIIDVKFDFINKRGNKQILTAFILKLYYKSYFYDKTFKPLKDIPEREITKFFAHRYGNNSDTDKEFRNFKTIHSHKYEAIIQRYNWLDSIF